MFTLGFDSYFGVERPLYSLAHALVTSWPVIGSMTKKWGHDEEVGALWASLLATRRIVESG